MKTQLKTTGLAILIAAAALSGCEKTSEAPAPEAAVQTPSVIEAEAAVVVIAQGGATAAIVVEKSTDNSDAAFIASSQIQTVTAKVTSINLETREVSLVGEEGVQLELIAPEYVTNLDQVSVGDTVNVKHIQRVSIELVQGKGLAASETQISQEAKAEEGEMPARAEVETSINVYTVEAINIEKNTFKLKDVENVVQEYTARDPKNLARAAVGDAVVVTITEALAVEVIKATDG